MDTAVELGIYMVLVNVLTFLLKIVFARVRPECSSVILYSQEDSFAYPSGHISRATGALIILSRQRSIGIIILVAIGVLLLSLSRVILGVHYPLDTVGAVFLSLAIEKIADIPTYKIYNSVKLKE